MEAYDRLNVSILVPAPVPLLVESKLPRYLVWGVIQNPIFSRAIDEVQWKQESSI